jgi:hypothetical protein
LPKSPIAEWLLTRVTSPKRSSEIIGDLIEQNTSRIAFYFAISRILIAFTWRWILGFALAGICAALVIVPYQLSVVPRSNLGRFESWVPWATYLSVAAVCFGTNTGLAISRYGFRDRLAWMSAALWLTLTVSSCASWVPYAPLIVTLLLIAGMAALFLFRATRALFVCVLVSTAAFAATSAVFILLSRLTSIPYTPASNTTNVIFGVTTCMTSIVIEAMVLARLRPIPFQPVIT